MPRSYIYLLLISLIYIYILLYIYLCSLRLHFGRLMPVTHLPLTCTAHCAPAREHIWRAGAGGGACHQS